MSENIPQKGVNWRLIAIFVLASAVLATVVLLMLQPGGFLGGQQEAEISGSQDPTEAVPPVSLEVPSFDVVRISRGGGGVIAGRASPGATVDIMVGDKRVATATADERGEWVVILEEPLESGSAELSLVARTDGATDQRSEEVVVIVVPERPDGNFLESTSDGVLAVLTPRDGEGTSRVLQKPGADSVGEIGDSLVIETLDYKDSGALQLTGKAVPRAGLRIYLDNVFEGEVRANDDGAWTLQGTSSVSPGSHTIRVDQVIGEGDVELRIEQPFETGADLDPGLAESKVVVQKGHSLWRIARRLYGSGYRYTLIFEENSEQIRDPDLIYPGQLFDVPDGPSESDETSK